MCGINGAFSFGRELLPQEVIQQHGRIAASLAHRGPDRTGNSEDPLCVLFANQLNINGLDNNVQPVASECGQVVSVLNGEIYNYRALNKELEQAGHPIRTNCDTETLNKLYLAYGADCFAKIHGIFGAAIYDKRTGRLILARDRFGQIPLFYCAERGRLHFASESNELIRFMDRDLDPDALLQYFAFGFSFDHLVKGIKRLRPGTFLVADRDGVRDCVFWTPKFLIDYTINERDAAERALDALRCGVRELAPREVPHGVFISGGIDSATVARIAEEQCSGIHLFTSGLTDACLGGEVPVDADYSPVEMTGNELAYADLMARNHSAEYVKTEYHVDDLIEALPNLIRHLPGGPVMSTSFPPFYFAARGAGRHNIRVNFTGEGADELHAGYLTCQPESYPDGGIASRFVDLSNFTSADERALFLGPNSGKRLREMCAALDADVDASFEGDGLPDDVKFNKLRYFMLMHVFTPHLVEKGNGMAMLGGPTELRMPFLSDGYMALALQAPPQVIRSSEVRKMLLHTLGQKAGVPDKIITRPKQRTSLPYYHLFYMDSRFRTFVQSILNEKSLLHEFIGLNSWGYVSGLAGKPDAHKRAWLMLILEIWLREVFDVSS